MKRLFIATTILTLSVGCFSAVPKRDDLKMLPIKAAPKTPAPETQPLAIDLPASRPAREAPFLMVPLGLDSENLNIPAANPLTPEKIELGRLLYFDARLSADNTVSCATCHNPDTGWTDQSQFSTGVKGQKGVRNSPTVINSTYMGLQFWDGRATNLEEQAAGPLLNPVEMGNKNLDEVVNKIREIAGYQPYFQTAFGEGPTKKNIVKAIASFERTVLSGNSRYDLYAFGDKTVMNESEIRGMEIFFGKANCALCHAGPNFSDNMFHNLGVGMGAKRPDLGRFVVTRAKADRGAFKTPTVREVAKTAPFMHDGSQKTLEEVVEFYNKGGEPNPSLDPRMKPLGLTLEEKADLVAFMKTLDGNPYPTVSPPPLPQ